MNPFFTDYSTYLSGIFPGIKVQKISVDAGRSCPNRDGTIGTGGCIYCDNRSFSPSYCSARESISEQIRKGKEFFRRKYPEMKYLVYFQSYTATHGSDNERSLTSILEEALSAEDVVGLVVGTRPDCVPAPVISMLAEANTSQPVLLEFGAETSHDNTLERINRGHRWSDTADAVYRSSEAGLRCGLHLIVGLPGETLDDAAETLKRACSLPVDSLKLHQLQIIRGTELWRQWKNGSADIKPLALEDYLDFCVRAVRLVPRSITIERFVAQAPASMLEAPRWGLKNYQFTDMLISRLKKLYDKSNC